MSTISEVNDQNFVVVIHKERGISNRIITCLESSYRIRLFTKLEKAESFLATHYKNVAFIIGDEKMIKKDVSEDGWGGLWQNYSGITRVQITEEISTNPYNLPPSFCAYDLHKRNGLFLKQFLGHFCDPII